MKDVRPHIVKTKHFLKVFPHSLIDNEWKVKFKMPVGEWRTYNPDFYCKKLKCFIEVATSMSNITESHKKWRYAVRKYGLRVFWWKGQEITKGIAKNYSFRGVLE